MKHLKKFNEVHDPRGKQINVNRFLIHKSMPENRENILKNGLRCKIGDRYQIDKDYSDSNFQGLIDDIKKILKRID